MMTSPNLFLCQNGVIKGLEDTIGENVTSRFQSCLKNLNFITRTRLASSLEEMYARNDPDLGYFGIKRPGDPLQSEPRYIAVMEKIGLW